MYCIRLPVSLSFPRIYRASVGEVAGLVPTDFSVRFRTSKGPACFSLMRGQRMCVCTHTPQSSSLFQEISSVKPQDNGTHDVGVESPALIITLCECMKQRFLLTRQLLSGAYTLIHLLYFSLTWENTKLLSRNIKDGWKWAQWVWLGHTNEYGPFSLFRLRQILDSISLSGLKYFSLYLKRCCLTKTE